MESKKVLKYTSKLIYLIYVISIVYFIFKNQLSNVAYALLSLVGSIILVYLSKKWEDLFDSILIINLVIFILFAGLLGSSYGIYGKIKGYDDFLHIWSGLVSCNVAYIIYKYFLGSSISSNKEKIFFVIFLFMFSMGGASLWELMEFAIDKYLGMNSQAGGLVDTMMDTFDCLIGSIIMIFYYLKINKKCLAE